MKHTVWILLLISILVAIYMLYRYIETSRIAKLMEKKKSLYTNEKSKVKNHSFFLVSSFLILCLSAGAAAKTIDADKIEMQESRNANNQVKAAYSMGQDPVAYDASPESAMDGAEAFEEGTAESKMLRESEDTQMLNAVNALLSETQDVRFDTMNAVDLVSYSFDEEAIANYLVEGQEVSIYQEGDEYYVEVRQVYRLEEVTDSKEAE